jgi:cupin 2 domain-containing protein
MSELQRANLLCLKGLPADESNEFSETLAAGNKATIERIVSRGHRSPDGFWYDEDQHEWVALLSGSAVLTLEGCDQPVVLRPGDWINIPAHTRHRVESTDANEPSVWLAIHYED